jgi:hypothetical protein
MATPQQKYGCVLSAAELKAFANFEEHLGEFSTWPKKQREALVAKTWHHNERWCLLTFFLGNGAQPLLLASHAVQFKKLQYKQSCDDFCAILRDHMQGKLAKFGYWHTIESPHLKRMNPNGACEESCPWRVSEFTCGKSAFMHWCLPLETPHFANDEIPLRVAIGSQADQQEVFYLQAGNDYWNDAILKVKQHKFTLPFKPRV